MLWKVHLIISMMVLKLDDSTMMVHSLLLKKVIVILTMMVHSLLKKKVIVNVLSRVY